VAEPYLLEEGDILLARSGGTVGKSFIYRSSWGECCYAGYLIRLRVAARTYQPDFVYLTLQSNAYWQQLGANQIQSTIQNFSAEKYGDMTFAFPPLDEQDAIACELSQRLSRFDKLSRQAEQAITLLQERRAALISAAVTGKIDVRGLVAPEDIDRSGSSDKLERSFQ
jgi:type I restriction enzyme S subunit